MFRVINLSKANFCINDFTFIKKNANKVLYIFTKSYFSLLLGNKKIQ